MTLPDKFHDAIKIWKELEKEDNDNPLSDPQLAQRCHTTDYIVRMRRIEQGVPCSFERKNTDWRKNLSDWGKFIKKTGEQ